MEYESLTNICRPKQWKTLTLNQLINGEYPVYGANGIIGYHNTYNHENPCLAIGCRGTCGSVFVSKPKSYLNGNAMALDKIDEEYDQTFLYYFLKYYDFSKVITGTSQPQITIKSLKEVMIPKIDKELQKKYIEEISIIDNLILNKKQEILCYDELIKSRFVEMFENEKEQVRLGDCCDVHARIGRQSLTKDEHLKEGDYMLITGTDFDNGEINYSTCVYVAKERFEMDKHIILKNDDVLITKDGTIGKVAVVHNLQKPATLNGGVFVVRPDNRFNKDYIASVFKGSLFLNYVETIKTGATIHHLNQKYLVEFKIPVPSIEKQNEFADFAKLIDKSKFVIQQQIKDLTELLEKKMDEYFNN